jgi:FlaA1/EpsC-like NDP-sugar epimerase
MTTVFPRRQQDKLFKVLLDVGVLSAAYCLAFLIRFEGHLPASNLDIMLFSLPAMVLVKWTCLLAARAPSRSWRHVSRIDLQCLLVALAVSDGLLILLRVTSDAAGDVLAATRWGDVPLGVLLIDLPLSLLGVMGVRAGYRLWYERRRHRRHRAGRRKVPTLLIGAGRAGALVVEELIARPDLGIQPVGFLDDDPAKVGKIIHGKRVLGTTADLQAVVEQCRAEQVLITIGGLPGPNVRRIRKLCADCGIGTKVIPGISEMVEGNVKVSTIREVSLEDLLHREPVHLDGRAIASGIRSRTVVITGAGGSIGSQLCREVCRFDPAALVLVEKAENSLFHLHLQLGRECPDVKVVPYVADVCDTPRMRTIFARWKPEVVFHAAAHKHVPLMEWNPGEAIKNNVLGTRALADLAHACSVAEFVLISTDKAVNPTSVMGVSKRVAEIYLQALSRRSLTRFVTVRFGNVLGSNGSVIPIFKEQLAAGGPLTVTHPDMRRYFMTIPEACQLVLQAAAMGKGGELFILDMGDPVRIVDLANDLIRLSGFAPEDVGIEFVGVRPGEKLFEELSLQEEGIQKTTHPRIYVGRLAARDWDEINREIEELKDVALRGDTPRLLALLAQIVPEYRPDGTPCLPAEKAPLAEDHAVTYLRLDVAQANGTSGPHVPPMILRDSAPPA